MKEKIEIVDYFKYLLYKRKNEIVDYFKYLGVPCIRNGKFTECRKYVLNQARKAMIWY